MKTHLLAGLVLLIASIAHADSCPELTGRYVCVTHNTTATMIFSQTVENGVTVYSIQGEDDTSQHIADNQWYPAPPQYSMGYLKDAKMRTHCENSAAVIEIEGKHAVGGTRQYAIQKLSLNEQRDLSNYTQVTIGAFPTPGTTIVCDRK